MITQTELHQLEALGWAEPDPMWPSGRHWRLTDSGRSVRRALATIDTMARNGTALPIANTLPEQ